jgi:hypothetical protein
LNIENGETENANLNISNLASQFFNAVEIYRKEREYGQEGR